jgi:glycosyltransferase involved in cell wall biosynthesis
MSDEKLVSVIIPTYNVKKEKLIRTIRSVLDQTYHPIEIIVMDDGSTNPFGGLDTSDFIEYVKETFPRKSIQFIEPGRHMGLASIKNLGISVSIGPYIAFLDCGDWWARDKIQDQMICFENSPEDCGLVYCGARIVSVKGDNFEELYQMSPMARGNTLYKSFLIYNRITGSNSSVLIKRTCLDRVGLFYDKEDIPEDMEMWSRIALYYSIDYVNKFSTCIEKDPNSMSADPEKKQKTYLRYFKLKEDELRKLGLWNKAMSQYYSIIGKKYFVHKRFFKGMKFFINSFSYGFHKQAVYRFAASIFEGVFKTHRVTKLVHRIRNTVL